jgi:hypothetical protein
MIRPPSSRKVQIVLMLCLAFALSALRAESAGVDVRAGEAESIASDPHWLALLQQSRSDLDREMRAALSGSGFFLSATGSPEDELDATLAAFRARDPERARHARCRFPARHRFLAGHGLVDAERGVCPELDAWRSRIGEFELTLVFPEAFLGNPASMFGHTLLRFDPIEDVDGEGGSELLGWALDYTADAEGDAGALYLMRGLLGGYLGRYSLDPYYEKIKVYSDWQDRDIWEYPLALSREEREQILLHVWELRDVALPYYFFTQNCSEKVLALLEVARPGLGRGGGFPPVVAPVDTLRAIASAGDPLGTPRLRASPATRLQRAVAPLSGAESDLAEALAEGRIDPDAPALETRPDHERARLLEIAYDLLRHRHLARKVDAEASRGRSRELLVARSRLAPRTGTEASAPDAPSDSPIRRSHPPDAGHGTARVEFAGGIQDRDGFIELRLQPGYHELLDAPAGFAEGGQIRVLDTRVRYFPSLDRVRLHELVLLDVVTASPWRRPFRPLGWRFDLGLRTRLLSSDRGSGLDTEGVFRMQGGLGAATAPRPGMLLYGFGELVLEAGPGLDGDLALGPVTRSGVVWSSPGERHSIQLEGIAGLLAGPGKTAPWLRLELSQRLRLDRKWSLVLSGRFEQAYEVGHFEGRLGLTRYF